MDYKTKHEVWAAEAEYDVAYEVIMARKTTDEDRENARNQCRVLAGRLHLWYTGDASEKYRRFMWLRRAYLHFVKQDGDVYDGIDPIEWYTRKGKALLGKRRLAKVLQD